MRSAVRTLCSFSGARTVRDLLSSKQSTTVKFVNADASVIVAAQQMVNNRVTSLVVKDEATDHVLGLVTQGDVVQALAAEKTTESCASIMTPASRIAIEFANSETQKRTSSQLVSHS